MASPDQYPEITDLRGGQNNSDSPLLIPDTQLVTAQNIEWHRCAVARRRQGSQTVTTGGFPTAGNAIQWLFRYMPSADDNAAELWALDQAGLLVRCRASATWGPGGGIALADAVQTLYEISAVSFNGKLFMAYNSGPDRLHVSDGTTDNHRRAGLATPAAATVADTGAGTYAATLRYYKVQWLNANVEPDVGSELSPAVSFTPSGGGTHARVTRPSLPSETETHWRLFGSPDGVNYYRLADIVVGTSTYDDNTAPSAYSTVSPTFAGYPTDAGYFTAPPSAKFLLVDGARLLLGGSWETTAYASRVWFTPVRNTTDPAFNVADDERVPPENYLDLDPGEGGGLTGLGGPIDGTPIAFKYSAIYKLVPTSNPDKPYVRIKLTSSVGALRHLAIVKGEDDTATPALYFPSRTGPYRLGAAGLQFLGRDIEDVWKRVNLDASVITAASVWHDEKRQWWLFVALDGAAVPSHALVFSVQHARATDTADVRGGWAVYPIPNGLLTACMFSKTVGATMSRALKPYLIPNIADAQPRQFDADGVHSDVIQSGTQGYRGYGRTKPYRVAGMGRYVGVSKALVLMQGQTVQNTNFRVKAVRDFGVESRESTLTVPAATADITHYPLRTEATEMAQAQTIQIEFGDADTTATSPWAMDGLTVRLQVEQEV